MSFGLMALGSVVSGLFGASSANKAAAAQERASQAAVEEQRRQYDLSRQDFEPFRQAGLTAQQAQLSMLGLGPAPMVGGGSVNALAGGAPSGVTLPEIVERQRQVGTRDRLEQYVSGQTEGGSSIFGMRNVQDPIYDGTEFAVGDVGFSDRAAADAYRNKLGALAGGGVVAQGEATPWTWQASPGYDFRMAEGQKALERAAAARGVRMSGATLNAAQAQAQGMASDEYWNTYNALGGNAATGYNATGQMANLGANAAGNIGNALMSGGQARASGYAGQNNAIQGMFGNLASLYGMNQAGYFGGKG